MSKKPLAASGKMPMITGPDCTRTTSNVERISDFGMIKVKARGNETVQQMMKRFKKMCEKEGLNKDVKRKSYYEKPSERRRRRARKSVKRVDALN